MADTEERIHCAICGRFIAMEDFEADIVGTMYTPDTPFTTEEIEYYHVSCDNR